MNEKMQQVVLRTPTPAPLILYEQCVVTMNDKGGSDNRSVNESGVPCKKQKKQQKKKQR